MTNKINGIDVSECFYFIDHTPPKGQGDWCGAIHKGACKVYSKDCKHNKDCYFKQLKRLQEELDIKEKMLDKFMIGSGEILEKLQKENEELKSGFNELYNNAKQLANKYNKYGGNKENELVEIINKITDERNKYKQTLEKIKGWATNHNPCDIEAGFNCTKEDCFKCLNYDIKKITTIIDEVLK